MRAVFGDHELGHPPDQPRTLAEKLNYLLDRIRRDDGRRFTHAQVADAVARSTGRPCDRGYISQLCSGTRDNPTMIVLEALADFFDVSPAFFFDDARSRHIAEQIELAIALQDPDTRALALEMLARLEPDDVDAAATVIRAIAKRRTSEADNKAPRDPY
ncbi:helix-turn-helix domain-containing protein [Actinophytocola sediminis]